ncbi:MAG: CPBP family intramembrane glutamic endopeptidase [Pirellulales bacterium]
MEEQGSYLTGVLMLALLAGSLMVWAALVDRGVKRHAPLIYEPRLPVPWSGLDVIVLGITVLLLQSLLVGAAAVATGTEPTMKSPAVLGAIVVSRGVWLLFAIGYLVRRAGAYADDMGFDLRRWRYDLRVAGLTFLAAIVPVYGAQLVLTQVFGYKSEHALVQLSKEAPNAGVLLLVSLAAVLVAPLVEEFMVRVVLQGWLEKKQQEYRQRRGDLSESPAGFGPIVVSAAIFAALHGWPDAIALFLLSLFLGYVYQRTHRIVAPLAIHVLVNSLAMFELWRAFLAGSL